RVRANSALASGRLSPSTSRMPISAIQMTVAAGVAATRSGRGAPTVVRQTTGWRSLGLREVWEYRELLYFLVWRDVKVRYKQTVIGVAWAVLQPVMLMLL